MYLSRLVKLQLTFFTIVTLIAGGTMAFKYLDLPKVFFGIGHYQVTVNLIASGGLYKNGNVTYRGVAVGRVQDVRLSPNGVDAVLSLNSDTKIPADLVAQVRSQTAVGELSLELNPRSGEGPSLKNGDVIPVDRTALPPDINAVLADTNSGLQAIPHDDLKTAVDEAYTAVGGLGPELKRIVDGTTTLAADARANLSAITTVIDQSKPILDTQIDTSDSIQAWAANLAKISSQLRDQDSALNGILNNGAAAGDEVRKLLNRLQPTLPVVLANLVSLEQVAITYQPGLEQLLVLLPKNVEEMQAPLVADRNTDHEGIYLSLNLNANVPPPCSTGFLPPQQMRPPSDVDYPQRPDGLLYCRVPQDSSLNVRGARNIPCETRPGKRAPTVKMCESDEDYVPLNDGNNWKGDPNATLSGQPVPQLPPPIAIAQYDPSTGTYTGPDGKQYKQTDLAHVPNHKTWQDLLVPPNG